MAKVNIEAAQNVEISKKFPCEKPLGEQLDIMERYTAVHRAHLNASKEMREAACLEVLYPTLFRHIQDGDRHLREQVLAQKEGASAQRKEELERMAESLAHIQDKAPETFHQALQLFWLYALLAGVINYGRLDDFLGPFLARDLKEGRIIVGGRGRKHPKEADIFLHLCMRVAKDCRYVEPQFTLRLDKNTSEQIWIPKCSTNISTNNVVLSRSFLIPLQRCYNSLDMATTFAFELANSANRSGEWPVYIRLTQERKKKRVKTNVLVRRKSEWNPKAWNENWVRTSDPEYAFKNEALRVELVRITRLKEAEKLLKTSEHTVAEIAYEVGFSSPSYFSKCYRELFGSLPTENR